MSYGNFGTTTLNGISISAGASPAPLAVPDALVQTRAVETKDGWVGQIIIAGRIIWETSTQKNSTKAEQQATERVVQQLVMLFE